MSKPTDPRKRLGVYKQIEDVHRNYRLSNYSDEYADRDVWSEWMETRDFADSTAKRVQRAEDSWKGHTADCGQHHALVTPSIVESWCEGLLERMTAETLYNRYYVHVEDFYHWLQWHADHPHRYNPVLMAVCLDGAARAAYDEKLELGQ